MKQHLSFTPFIKMVPVKYTSRENFEIMFFKMSMIVVPGWQDLVVWVLFICLGRGQLLFLSFWMARVSAISM